MDSNHGSSDPDPTRVSRDLKEFKTMRRNRRNRMNGLPNELGSDQGQ